jgi:predicted DNA-binding transcriptional regulator AlpA
MINRLVDDRRPTNSFRANFAPGLTADRMILILGRIALKATRFFDHGSQHIHFGMCICQIDGRPIRQVLSASVGTMKRAPSRIDILPLLPVVFGLGEMEAAAAIGVSASKFRLLVKEARMPRPRRIGSRAVWDVDELRAAFKALPHEGETEGSDTWADVV